MVGLNYRLGVLGFLSSKELREDARTRGEKGFNNLGLHDQRVALQWVRVPKSKHPIREKSITNSRQVQKHIHLFGGDGSRLTVAGESAGACSIIAHLRGQVPLFQDAFIMSPAMVIPVPLHETQVTYDHVVATVGLSNAPAGQQLSALRSMSPMELQSLVADRKPILSEDSEFFSDWTGQRWEEISTFPSWVHRVVVGQTMDESILFAQQWATMAASELYDEWEQVYPDPAYAQEVLSAYGITKSS